MKEYSKIQSIYKRDQKGQFTKEYSLEEIEYLKDNNWIGTEKVDGTNIRIMWDGETVKIGGRTDNAQIPTFLYTKLTELFTYDKMNDVFGEPICLYGEGYGAKIQKGGGNYIKDGVNFVLFDALVDSWWLKRDSLEEIKDDLQIDLVPVRFDGTLDEAVEMTKGRFNSRWGNFDAEGLVLKPKVELTCRNGDRLITKVKTKDFKMQ